LPGKMPVKTSQPPAARMVGETDAVEGHETRTGEFRRLGKAAAFVGIVPDEENLVGRVESVDLKLVIRVAPGDEHFDVVVIIDR